MNRKYATNARVSQNIEKHFDKLKEYADGKWQDNGEALPTVCGMILHAGISKSTAYDWRAQSKQVAALFDKIMAKQEVMLISNGLVGNYNATIAKVLLTKHGYNDKVDTDITSRDGSASAVVLSKDVALAIAKKLNDDV